MDTASTNFVWTLYGEENDIKSKKNFEAIKMAFYNSKEHFCEINNITLINCDLKPNNATFQK